MYPRFVCSKNRQLARGFLPLLKFEELACALPLAHRPLITFLYYCSVGLGQALQIEWSQVDLDNRLIRLEDDQTKTGEARIVPLPGVLAMQLAEIEAKVGKVLVSTNLRTEWARACAAVGLGKLELRQSEDGYPWHRYNGLLVHDLRRSAIRNLVNAGVPERIAMKISGHKIRSVFDRYHIVSTDDVADAARGIGKRAAGKKNSAKLVQNPARSTRKSLKGA